MLNAAREYPLQALMAQFRRDLGLRSEALHGLHRPKTFPVRLAWCRTGHGIACKNNVQTSLTTPQECRDFWISQDFCSTQDIVLADSEGFCQGN